MERTWHPNRFKNWCLDQKEKKKLKGDLNK